MISSQRRSITERKGRRENKRKEKRERKERKRKKRNRRRKGGGLIALPPFFRRSTDQGVGIVHAPRGIGFSYSSYFMLKGHSMAIGFDPNHRVGS